MAIHNQLVKTTGKKLKYVVLFSVLGLVTVAVALMGGFLGSNKQTTEDSEASQLTDKPITKVFTIKAGTDDAGFDAKDCSFKTDAKEIHLGSCKSNKEGFIGGLRFQGVDIPAGSTIKSAVLQISSDGNYSNALKVGVYGEASLSPKTFSTSADLTKRKLTSSFATLDMPASSRWITKQKVTLNVTTEFTNIVKQKDWKAGAVAFIMKIKNGTEYRRFMSFEQGAATAPTLAVTYIPPAAPKIIFGPAADKFSLPSIKVSLGVSPAAGYKITYQINGGETKTYSAPFDISATSKISVTATPVGIVDPGSKVLKGEKTYTKIAEEPGIVMSPENRNFSTDKLKISLAVSPANSKYQIKYKIDGGTEKIYSAPFEIGKTSKINVTATASGLPTFTLERTYTKVATGPKIVINPVATTFSTAKSKVFLGVQPNNPNYQIKYKVNNGIETDYVAGVGVEIDKTSKITVRAVGTDLPTLTAEKTYTKVVPTPTVTASKIVINPVDTNFYSVKGKIFLGVQPNNPKYQIKYKVNGGVETDYTSGIGVEIDKTSKITVRAVGTDLPTLTAEKTYTKVTMPNPTNLKYSCDNTGSSIDFTWNDVTGAKTYLVGILDSKSTLISAKIVADNKITFPNIQSGATYAGWFVQPLYANDNNEFTLSATKYARVSGTSFICMAPSPDVPTIGSVPTVTNLDHVTVSGKKPAGSAIVLDGKTIIGATASTDWAYDLKLNIGQNRFEFWSISNGSNSGKVVTNVERCAYGDINCDGKVNIIDFSWFIKAYKLTEWLDFMDLADINNGENVKGDKKMDITDFTKFRDVYIKNN